jgi:outer membrane protein
MMPGFSTRNVIPSHLGMTCRSGGFLVLAVLAGCATPYGQDPGTARLEAVIQETVARQTEQLEAQSDALPPPTALSEVETALEPRRSELDRIGPQPPRAGASLDLGTDLLGQPQEEVALALRDAVSSAIEHNLTAQAARLGQGISETDVVRAEAAFDAVLFANFDFLRLEQPQIVAFSSGFPLGAPTRATKEWGIETGLRNRLESGGVVEVSTAFRNNDIADTAGITFEPDPAWSSAVSLGFTQPLLRGFGSDVALSEVRLARNAARTSNEELRGRLMEVIAETEATYWDLVLARQQLVAAEWLVDVGVEVRDVLARRRGIDVTDANYADAVATVERRKGDLILARRNLRAASDLLKARINQPDLPVGDEILVVPSDWMTDQPVQYGLKEAIALAIQQAPVVRQALLSIDDASIGVDVADNARLPQLDLQGQVRWNGLDSGFGSSYGDLGTGDYIDYLAGLQFQQALGNRAAEAFYRQARLRRSSAVVGYQQAVQQTVLLVKNALRDVRSNQMLVGQYRALRLAQAENLRALQVDERTKAALTPEFLALKFQRQDGLASAQVREVKALVDYNSSIARLFRAMGVGLQMNRIEVRIDDSTPLKSAASVEDPGGGE